jgi:hypothetical protein
LGQAINSGVWSGTPGSLTPVTCNDDAGGTSQSLLTFTANAVTTNYIAVSQYNGTISKSTAADKKGLIGIVNVRAGFLNCHATSFADVHGNAWYWHYVEGFFANGITTGCAQAPLRDCPGQSVTRAEMATFIDRAFGFPQLP